MLATAVIDASNEFGFALLRQLSAHAPQENVFISPLSISLALAMIGNGADRPTSLSLRHTLRLGQLDWPAINSSFATWQQQPADADPEVLLELANSLWAEPNFSFAPAFEEIVSSAYGALLRHINFGDVDTAVTTINDWVAAHTHDKIRHLLQAGDVMGAALILINATYFKGNWTDSFDTALTQPGEFHCGDGSKQQLAMMQRSGAYHYADYQQWQMISLPFGDGRLSMIIVLPQRGITLSQIFAGLNRETWNSWLSRLQLPSARIGRSWNSAFLGFGRRPGTISLPRFQVGYRVELLPYLQFATNSFPGLSSPPDPSLFISKVIHQTFLELNEAGAEAAAATAVIVARSVPPPPFQMIVDRPFFCAIRDNLNHALLFLGTVQKPS